MKKILILVMVVSFAAMLACGPSSEEKAAAEKARQDSINAVMTKQAEDSLMAAQAMTEQARQDSINMAMYADSVAKAEAAGKKKTSSNKPKKPTSTVPDTRSETTKEADKKVENAFDKFKKKK